MHWRGPLAAVDFDQEELDVVGDVLRGKCLTVYTILEGQLS